MNKDILNKLHNEMLIIYEEIERICQKHNLTYFVVGGTLIGAVVHKGYIPWDDDLDVAMPRDDYDKFIELCPKETSASFLLHHTTTDDNYWLPFAKLRLKNTVFLEEKRKNVDAPTGIYVDIFPFDYAPNCNTAKAKVKWRIMTWINNYINQKVTGSYQIGISGKFLNILLNCFSIKKLSLFRDKIMRSFDCGERKQFVDLAGGRRLDNSYFQIDKMIPVHKMPFENINVEVPADPDYYLTILYTKKYLIIPPIEERKTHNPLYIRFEDGTEVDFRDSL